jgi:hypothetical protein
MGELHVCNQDQERRKRVCTNLDERRAASA